MAGLILLSLIAILFLFVRVEQYRFRSRTERLHAEILALQLHPGDFADIQRLQREWGSHVHYDGPCTPHHCIYEILIYDALDDWLRKPTDSRLSFAAFQSPFALRASALFGGRPGFAAANVRVRDNRIWSADFEFGHFTFPGKGRNRGYPYLVIAGVDSGSRLSNGEGLSSRDLLRGFRVNSELNCLGCELVFVHLTPETKAPDIERFNRLNFGCITAIFACKHPEELAPEAWNQASRDEQDKPESERQACALPLTILARDTNDIILAKVLSINEGSSPAIQSYRKVRVQELDTPKNGQDFRNSDEGLFVPAKDALRPENAGDSAQLTVGKDYFFFFEFWRPNPDPMVIDLRPEHGTYLDPCHVLANTPANAASIQEGIALDPSNGEPYSF